MEFNFDDFTCCQFSFNKDDSNELIFFSATELFKFDISKQKSTVFFTIANYFKHPVNFGILSKDQKKCILTSRYDILYIDTETGMEVDLDDQENISEILNIIGDERYFYVLANKKDGILGYYLLMIDIMNPE